MKHFDPNLIYHIFPLGFCDAPHLHSDNLPTEPRLLMLLDHLDHIQSLGADTILLGPLFESSTHGYDTIDYFQVDRRLGTNDTLKTVSSEIHSRGMRMVFDAVFNHTGRGFRPFVDVQHHGEQSQYRDWFHNLRFDGHNQMGDPFHYEGWNGHQSLVKLNQKNPDVVSYLMGVVKFWIAEFEADGMRLDAADCLAGSFIEELTAFSRDLKPDFWLMGEVVNGDYRKYLGENRLDSVTNYEGYKSLYSSQNDQNYFEIAYSLNRCFGPQGIYKGFKLNNFADNHDVTRIASILKDTQHLVPALIILMTMPGVPAIYYGGEWGFTGTKGGHDDWQLRPGMNAILNPENQPHPYLFGLIQKLAGIRSQSQAIRDGSYEQVLVQPLQIGYLRRYDDEEMLVFVNGSATTSELRIPNMGGVLATDCLNGLETFSINNDVLNVSLQPYSGRILRIS